MGIADLVLKEVFKIAIVARHIRASPAAKGRSGSKAATAVIEMHILGLSRYISHDSIQVAIPIYIAQGHGWTI